MHMVASKLAVLKLSKLAVSIVMKADLDEITLSRRLGRGTRWVERHAENRAWCRWVRI
jgi:hypothetical protein